MSLFQRSLVVFLVICAGCSAQSVSPDLSQKIERRVRSYYKVPPQVKVVISPLKPSEFPNYDAVTVTFDTGEKQQPFDFLLSRDGKTLARFNKMDLTSDPYAEVMQKINTTGRPIRGNKSAKVVAVNFDDFQCPFCSRMHQTLFPGLMKEYGDRVQWIYKDFPLVEIHPWAMHAAVDANCLAAQNGDAYWQYADYLHDNQKEVGGQKGHDAQFAALDSLAMKQGETQKVDATKLQACIKAQDETAVKASMHEGEALGVEATPSMFVNGEKIDGALPVEEVRAVLDRALQQAGVAPPVHAPATPPVGAPAPGK
ncbi:MAG TPA: thioredoxin domain-containing protein [Terriglobales bacterium]|nr:thioredoxin domain-containing protein [Terriglobales bacterium]